MSEDNKSAVYMIEGGKALDLVREHIADRLRVRKDVAALCEELGVEPLSWRDRQTGVLTAVSFRGAVHPDFRVPDRRGQSRPKKGTAWFKRFSQQVGYENPVSVIAKAFGVPLSISYTTTDGGRGWRCIGAMCAECGWLFLSADGPYAMWLPDVQAAVAASEKRGETVLEPAKSWQLNAEGCRRIEPEEWELLVLQQKLAEKRQAVVA